MKRGIFGIFIIGLFLTFTEAKAENWKQYFKDEDGIWYFDKDSIHYPDKTDKSILRVWSKFGGKWLLFEQLYCSTREIEIVERYDSTGLRPPIQLGHEYIKPGSRQEKLYNEVCK